MHKADNLTISLLIIAFYFGAPLPLAIPPNGYSRTLASVFCKKRLRQASYILVRLSRCEQVPTAPVVLTYTIFIKICRFLLKNTFFSCHVLHISKKNRTLGKLPAAMRHSPQCTCLVFINMRNLRAKRLKPLIDCFSVVYRE